MESSFLKDYLLISTGQTLLFLLCLFALFVVMKILEKRKASFSLRMSIGTGLGLLLGLFIQAMTGFSDNPTSIASVKETTAWFGLFGNGFLDLIRMLVIPLIMVSIVHVIINVKENTNITKLTRNTVLLSVLMVTISSIIGFSLAIFANLGVESGAIDGNAQIKEVTTFVATLRNLIPANPIKSMLDLNVIALIIMSFFFGSSARRLSKKYMEIVKPFIDLINALHKIIVSVAMTIIKLMPYAVIALLANTIAQRGLQTIIDASLFILILFVSCAIMFIIQLLALSLFGLNPVQYVKKAISVLILAFTSRSSIGTLTLTIQTLTKKLGVNEATANFVASFGSTAGMQGCAGIFPAMILVYVANIQGIPIDLTYIVMSM
ncbi:MAG: cation:dicarboxylate symporter family transporter, partial [Oscillospiraceae bacterium]